MDKFSELCESIGQIKTTTRQFYPRNLKLSENFLRAFKEEYENQRKSFLENNEGKNFQTHAEKVLKALRFEMRDCDEKHAQSEQAIKRKLGPGTSAEDSIITTKKFKNMKVHK